MGIYQSFFHNAILNFKCDWYILSVQVESCEVWYMEYKLISAENSDILYIKYAKLYNIFSYAHNLSEEEISRINKYVDKHIPMEMEHYNIVIADNKKVGCCLLVEKDDGIILEEIYLDEEYRNKGIGTDIIKNILQNSVVEETDIRYYMEYAR